MKYYGTKLFQLVYMYIILYKKHKKLKFHLKFLAKKQNNPVAENLNIFKLQKEENTKHLWSP